jgi:phenylacetate-CoA ligase
MDKKQIELIRISSYLDFEDQIKLQQDQLRIQSKIWLRKDNYFKSYLTNLGINHPNDFDIKLLESIPTTSKYDISTHFNQFINSRIKVADYCTTSGTTGNFITVPLSKSDINRLALNESISFENVNLTSNDILMLCTTIDKTFMAGLAYLEGARKLNIPIVRAGIVSPALHWEYIQRFSVTSLIAVPSYINKLLQYAHSAGINPMNTSVKKIICIGESIKNINNEFSFIGKKINEYWPISYYSTYASTEIQTAFTECDACEGAHHIPGLLICEFLDDTGMPVNEGEIGELTITHLGVQGFPLLRFRTGDLCVFTKSPCKCGRKSIRIKSIVARKNEMLKIKGTTVFPSNIVDMLNQFDNMNDFLIVADLDEYALDQIKIYYISSEDCHPIQNKVNELLRFTPEWIKSSHEQIEILRSIRYSRKLLKFVDLRSN